MSSLFLKSLVVVALIVANGVFAASELALVSVRRARLREAADDGDRRALAALALAEEPNRFLATVQIGITLVGTLAGALGGGFLAHPLADLMAPVTGRATAETLAFTAVVLSISYLSLVIGELVPKRLAMGHPEAVALRVAPGMERLARLTGPVVRFLSASTELVVRLTGRGEDLAEEVTESDIVAMARHGMEAGTVAPSELEIIEGAFGLTDVSVRAVMTPRPEVVAVAVDTPPDALVQTIIKSGFTRLPVYRDSLEHVIGIVHAKDVLELLLDGPDNQADPEALASLVRPIKFVPESVRVVEVLQHFRASHAHLAGVVDEYGQFAGLVTLEDVFETMIGDIEDEHDVPEHPIVEREDGSFLVDGLLAYVEAEEALGFPPRDRIGHPGDFDTVAGLVLHTLGHIPTEGDTLDWRAWRLEVVDMDGQRIDKVLVTPSADERL